VRLTTTTPAIVAFMCAVVSCSAGEDPRDPASELRSALEATVAATSFAVSSTVRYEGEVVDGEVRHTAPDRYTITGAGERYPTTIGVGRDTYLSLHDQPDRYQLLRSACDVPIDEVVSFLGVVGEARDVEFVDRSYRFSVPSLEQPGKDGEIEVEAAIGGRYLASVRLRYHLSAVDTRCGRDARAP